MISFGAFLFIVGVVGAMIFNVKTQSKANGMQCFFAVFMVGGFFTAVAGICLYLLAVAP